MTGEQEARPNDDLFYETRVPLFSQGDIFYDVPLAYPMPAYEIVGEEPPEGGRLFLSGPLEIGNAMIITPTCSMTHPKAPSEYAHPVRTLVPLLPLTDGLRKELGLDEASRWALFTEYDRLINYMFLPASIGFGLPDSIALLYMPVTLHHNIIEGQRITQLALEGARQLQRKLCWFMTGLLLPRGEFQPPMD